MLVRKSFLFFMLIQHTFLNRKYSVDLKSEAYFASFLLWHLCMFSRLIAVIPYIHTCSDSTSNSLLRGYSSFFMYAEHVVSAVYCWINPWVNLLSAPQKNDRRWRRGVSKLPFRSYQRFIWGERHQERVASVFQKGVEGKKEWLISVIDDKVPEGSQWLCLSQKISRRLLCCIGTQLGKVYFQWHVQDEDTSFSTRQLL